MGAPENEHIFGIQIRESANDGSDFSNADSDYRKLFLGEDGDLHLKDSAGTVTDVGGGGSATGNRTVFIPGAATPKSDQGTWVQTLDLVFTFGCYITNASAVAQNDYIEWEVLLEAGTYSLTLFHGKNTNRGIYTVTIDGGSSLGTIDGYNAGGGVMAFDTITGIVVATTAIHTMRFAMLTKNASSSNYIGPISGFTMTRTGA